MSELADYRKKLYWICDECGCENEFNENEQNAICPSCGAAASRKAIQDAKHALEEYKKEKKRIEEAERVKKAELYKAQQRAKRNELIVKSFHVVPYVYIVALIAALVLTVMHIFAQKLDISNQWIHTVSMINTGEAVRHIKAAVSALIHVKKAEFINASEMLSSNTAMLVGNLSQYFMNLYSNSPYMIRGIENVVNHLIISLRVFIVQAWNNILTFGESILELIER